MNMFKKLFGKADFISHNDLNRKFESGANTRPSERVQEEFDKLIEA